MTLGTPFSSYERRFILFVVITGLVGLFYQLGIYPLFLEEPRRALISLEMDLQNNLWVPTQTGDPYYRKPPFFNWVYIFFSNLFGGYSEIVLRSISIISHLLLSVLVFSFFKKRTSFEIALLTSLSFFLSVDILFYFSTLGEIDLFYALITTVSIMVVFIFDERKQYWSLFILMYLLTAVCFLTKGLSALPYTALTLLAYFIVKGRFKVLLSLPHFTGILVFVTVIASYFYMYSLSADVDGWYSTLISESADKATGSGFSKWLSHFVSFPFDTLKNVMPATLVLPALFLKGDKRKVDRAWVWIILVNFAVYWFSTEGRSRYVYPIFPFICYYFIERTAAFDKKWFNKYLSICAYIMLAIITLALPILPFTESLDYLTNQWAFVIVSELLLGVIWLSLLRFNVRPFLIVMGVLVVAKLGMSYVAPQSRVHRSDAMDSKQVAYQIAELTDDHPIYRWGNVRVSMTTLFYLTKEKQQVLYNKKELEEGAFYFIYEKDLDQFPDREIIVETSYDGNIIYLVKAN